MSIDMSKPAPRALIAIVIVAAIIFGVKMFVTKSPSNDTTSSSATASSSKQESGGGGLLSGIFGSSKPDITVCTNTWGGYAGMYWYNGGKNASKNSRFYKEQGITVALKNIDDPGASFEAWKSGSCDLEGAFTQGVWTTKYASVAEFQPKVIMKYDWSDKGDVIVARSGINTVQDLKGKKIAMAPGTPSHELLLVVLRSAGMTMDDINLVQMGSAPDAATAFKSGSVDAAVVWSPDDLDCLKAVEGSKILVSTGQFNNVIADVLIAKQSTIDAKGKELLAFVKGTLIANAELNASSDKLEESAKILADNMSAPLDLMQNAVKVAKLSTYGDNVNFFNLGGAYKGAKGEDIWMDMGNMFRQVNMIAGNLPAYRSTIDTQFIAKASLTGGMHNAAPSPTFSTPTAEVESAPALSTKHVTVYFATNSDELDAVNKGIIDREVVNYVKYAQRLRLRIEGNTDSTGAAEYNRVLSKRRAASVANWLAVRYSFDPNRFVSVGNGPDKPIASNEFESGRKQNRRTDFELLVPEK